MDCCLGRAQLFPLFIKLSQMKCDITLETWAFISKDLSLDQTNQ